MTATMWGRMGLSALSGALVVLSLPPFDAAPLAWVGLVPLLWALRGVRPRTAAGLGFVAGLVAELAELSWIPTPLVVYGNLPYALGLLALVSLAAYLALYVAAFAAGMAWLQARQDGAEVPGGPLLWVALEYGRTYLLSGFPWLLLGYSQYQVLPVLQIADVTGIYGVSGLLVLVNVLLARAAQALGAGDPLPRRELTAGGALVALVLAYGGWQLHRVRGAWEAGTPLKVGVVQGNIDQARKWRPEFQQATLAHYERLTRGLAEARPMLVVWPETATPFYFQASREFQPVLFGLADALRAALLFGSPGMAYASSELQFHNSAFLVQPGGQVLGRYDKLHLVPFGEYIPLAWLVGRTGGLIQGAGAFSPGQGQTLLPLGSLRIGVLICYEAIFPELSRRAVRAGAGLLVNLTNDAWFGRTGAPAQHLAMTVVRAVENRVPVVRAANTGISAVVGTDGAIRATLPQFRRGSLVEVVRLSQGGSLYTRIGDLFAQLCAAGAVLLGVILCRRRP